jgi:GT2 family glycosyltransferase
MSPVFCRGIEMLLLRRSGMPVLSIILVNYKVPHFLEQCLLSVEAASVGLEVEVIVVDNASADGSVEYLSPRFPSVRFLVSEKNLGFGKACNWGFRESRGRYILFLNPDTLLSEDALRKSIEFLESKPEAGAIGIRMIDGSGKFLPESKRAFPHPVTAFYKMIGLSALFPRSPRLARYYLGHLSAREDHPIDVVAGAYFLTRRSVLEQVGTFDEQFFMYGEDIDLSYRIQHAGYTNYYFSGSTILHFKGESTQKQHFRYVKLFYGAMRVFVQKHRLHNGLFTLGIQGAIGLRAMIAWLRRGIDQISIPVFDWVWILATFIAVRIGWSAYVRPDVQYPENLTLPIISYALFFFLVTLFVGSFRTPFRWRNFWKAAIWATGLLLITYSLLPESYRYSRGIVLFGSVFSVVILALWRLLLLKLQLISRSTEARLQFPVLLVGSVQSSHHIQQLYPEQPAAAFIQLEPDSSPEQLSRSLKEYNQLIRFSDVVFCIGDLSHQQMFSLMEQFGRRFSYRFFAPGASSILPLRKS